MCEKGRKGHVLGACGWRWENFAMGTDDFCGIFKPIEINDYAWLGVGCTILQNVVIGKGAVVCAGAVVTRNVEDFAVVAGVPAKKIGERTKSLDYKCRGWMPFT